MKKSMVGLAKPKVDPVQQIRLYFKRIDTMAIILPLSVGLFFFISLIFNSRHIPHFIPYNSSSDELSIYTIALPRDYLDRVFLGLMTSFFSAWLVKYIIETNALRRDRGFRLLKAYRGVYSLIAIVIEAATDELLYSTQSTMNDPAYFEKVRSIHYSHEMIDPVLSRRIPPHDSTDDMSDCVNNISKKLNSCDPNLIATWPKLYIRFKLKIKGSLEREKKGDIIDAAISDAIRLGNWASMISNFNYFTEQILFGRWDHFTPEESIKHIDIYLKEAVELAKKVAKKQTW